MPDGQDSDDGDRAARSGKLKPKSATLSRVTWAAAIILLFVIIVIYETRQALQEGKDAAPPPSADTAGGAPTGGPSSAALQLIDYYKSHELPAGWRIAEIDMRGAEAAVVAAVFSPSLQDSRYGQEAPAEDVAGGSFCPLDAALWRATPALQVQVELSDKRGVVATRPCPRP